MLSDRLLLILAALGLVPIALSYGLVPSQTLPFLIDLEVEGQSQTHVFRAVMGLYLANVILWLAGAAMPSLTGAALWSLLIFMAGLAAGRVISLIIDGIPGPVLIFYLCAEVVFAVLAFINLSKSGSRE